MSDSHADATKSYYGMRLIPRVPMKMPSFMNQELYVDYLSCVVRDRFGLTSATRSMNTQTRRILDIGGGTGYFTRQLVDGVSNLEAVVVDPFLLEASSLTEDDDEQIRFVKAAAPNVLLLHQTRNGGEVTIIKYS